uniref:Uncharacterized protein n=1 Tax=Thermosporothrix sp. COM3 TaxID=2490863 RepID=A0A455SGM0_9CHLR|nr:hypothetical protein KTC_09030 [Thermosporothrix sp. COM3]
MVPCREHLRARISGSSHHMLRSHAALLTPVFVHVYVNGYVHVYVLLYLLYGERATLKINDVV